MRTILIVDTSRMSLALLHDRLCDAQGEWRILHARDGEAALQVALVERPDLVTTELDMPGMDGLTLLRELKARWPDGHVALICEAIDPARRAEAEGLGALVLLKPVTEEKVEALLALMDGANV